MSLPGWVQEEGDEYIFGTATALGAGDVVLLSKNATTAFVAAKKSAGNFCSYPRRLFLYASHFLFCPPLS
jgi:hypothetical protein